MTINRRVTSLDILLIILTVFIILLVSAVSITKLFISERKTRQIVIQKKTETTTPQYPFRVGEKLHYGIYSAGIKVGKATITYLGEKEIDGRLVSCITIEAKAPGFYDLEKIYGNIENSTPIRIEREIKLFGKDIHIIEEYNQMNNEVLITRVSKKTETKRIKSQEKINNIILLLYQLRYKKDYKIGDKLQFNLPTKSLEMLVDRETQIKVPKGRYKAIFIRSIPSRFKVWFQKDKDSIPLRIQGAIGFGNTYLALISVD